MMKRPDSAEGRFNCLIGRHRYYNDLMGIIGYLIGIIGGRGPRRSVRSTSLDRSRANSFMTSTDS